MNAFRGMSVRVTPDIPKMRLREDLPLPEAFRAEMNAWLKQRFGYTNTLADGQIYAINGETVMMNPRTFAQFRREIGGAI